MMTDNDTLMANMTANARSAARCLAGANDATKASALLAAAAALRASVADILAANAKDVAAAVAAGISPAMLDRLKLDETTFSVSSNSLSRSETSIVVFIVVLLKRSRRKRTTMAGSIHRIL